MSNKKLNAPPKLMIMNPEQLVGGQLAGGKMAVDFLKNVVQILHQSVLHV